MLFSISIGARFDKSQEKTVRGIGICLRCCNSIKFKIKEERMSSGFRSICVGIQKKIEDKLFALVFRFSSLALCSPLYFSREFTTRSFGE